MSRNEAQSEIVGVVLILGITFASIGVILLLGQPILSDATNSATVDRVQNEMITLDSRLTAASVGTSVNETLTFNLEGGSLTSEPDATRFNVSWDGNTINRSIGKIEYENGETAVAYEAGGIWRRNTLTGASFMISPPDFTFDGETLSLPVYNVTSEGGYSGPNTLSVRGGNRTKYHPNATESNPVDGNVTVTVETQYHQGWARYFENQLRGNVTVNNETTNEVTAELLALNTPDSIDWAGASKAEATGSVNNVFGSFEDGVEFPSADGTIGSYVEYAESNIDSSAVGDLNSTGVSYGPGVYYNATDEYTMTGEDFNAAGSGNITVVIDGDLTVENIDADVNADDKLTIVTTGDLKFANGYTIQDSGSLAPESVIFQTTSNGEVIFEGGDGNPSGIEGYGTVYAPDSLVSLSEMGEAGGSEWTGPVVAEVFDAGGVDSDASITFGGSVDVQPADTEIDLYVIERKVGIE